MSILLTCKTYEKNQETEITLQKKNKKNKVQYPVNSLLENKIKNKNSKLENKK